MANSNVRRHCLSNKRRNSPPFFLQSNCCKVFKFDLLIRQNYTSSITVTNNRCTKSFNKTINKPRIDSPFIIDILKESSIEAMTIWWKLRILANEISGNNKLRAREIVDGKVSDLAMGVIEFRGYMVYRSLKFPPLKFRIERQRKHLRRRPPVIAAVRTGL